MTGNSQAPSVRLVSRPVDRAAAMEDVMSKGRDRPGKEKRKPKADKNKKQKGPAAAAAPTQLHIGTTPPPIKKM